MEYIYSALLLHSTKQPINEDNVKKILQGAGVQPDDAKVKALVASMEGVNIELYPNPTTGKLYISGVETGNRIQVYNTVGAMIRDISVQRNIETISLDAEPAGMYMIVVSDDNQMLGRYKALKR